ncbi:MAG: hypothetical protein AAB388_03740 [Patescibacteria group bacterium]
MNVIYDEDSKVRDLELAMYSYLEADCAEEAAERVVGKTIASAEAALRLMRKVGAQKFREDPESVTPKYMLVALYGVANQGFLAQADVHVLEREFRQIGDWD